MVLRTHHLLSALGDPRFRALLRVRLAGQLGDGVFQASLAGAVLFDPQRAGHAADVAAAFAILLLPYSVIGPFAGVFIDRWWRRRVLAVANLVRAIAVLGVAAELAAGVEGRVWSYAPVPVHFVIEEVDEAMRTWSWTARLGPVAVHLAHGVQGGALKTTTWLDSTGPTPVVLAYAPLARLALRRLVR